MNTNDTPAPVRGSGSSEGLGGCALHQLRELVVCWQYDKDCPAKVVAEIDMMLAAPQPAGGAQGDEDLQTRYELVRSWHADDQRRVNLLVQHLRAVLEVARTWQPDYATKMDRDTLDLAAAEVGHEPLNV